MDFPLEWWKFTFCKNTASSCFSNSNSHSFQPCNHWYAKYDHLPNPTQHHANSALLHHLQFQAQQECDGIYSTCFPEPISSMYCISVLIKHVLYVFGLLCSPVLVTVKLCQNWIWCPSHMSWNPEVTVELHTVFNESWGAFLIFWIYFLYMNNIFGQIQ